MNVHFCAHTAAPPRRSSPRQLVVHPAGLMRELCTSATDRAVLHATCTTHNILRDAEAWLAIDPHGIVGDPGYEVGALPFNPDPDNRDETLTALVPPRAEQLADELAMPADRVVASGFVKATQPKVSSIEG